MSIKVRVVEFRQNASSEVVMWYCIQRKFWIFWLYVRDHNFVRVRDLNPHTLLTYIFQRKSQPKPFRVEVHETITIYLDFYGKNRF